MSMNITEYERENFGIVIVDAQKFLRLWRADPHGRHRAEANGTPESWPNDRKYSDAVKGFSHGRENPVPLADVSYGKAIRTSVTYKFLRFGRSERQEEVEYVAFTNGITRTIWLLTNGCMAFPVMCGISCARELFGAAAAEGTSFYSLSELAEVASHAYPEVHKDLARKAAQDR
ncbi:hypothetical protein GH865_12945 [Rhodocyclus tenuis]|uniref:plasmid fertility inhibition factor family protein n=1 Tax=Rhodocyclus gracilis TaxID=2929842 RepID=UPI00129895E0|nr:hypothetical protein [Rhodocyclus gracilis]MRD74146.1 hypothetical protein [Rhodocyclus gracilis]